MKKKLYLANPYGFSRQTKKLLPEFIKIFNDLNLEVYEPFDRTKHLISDKNDWAHKIAKTNLVKKKSKLLLTFTLSIN